MTRTVAGQDPDALKAAFDAFYRAQTLSALQRVLTDHAIVRSAGFLALLRQDFLRSSNAKSPGLDAFRERYSDFVSLLDVEAYTSICDKVAERVPHAAHERPRRALVPELHVTIAAVLEERMPLDLDRPFDPASQMEAIREWVDSTTGGPTSIPNYAAVPGLRWSLVVVRCAACRSVRIDSWCSAVDLVEAPHLRTSALDGVFSPPECRSCGEVAGLPLGVILEDAPLSVDPVAALSSAWRIAPNFFVYRPPPGYKRQTDLDRVHEIRFGLRTDNLGWRDALETGDGARALSLAVAYSPEELQKILIADDEPDDVPRAMRTMIPEVAGKIRSGAFPIFDAEQQIARTVSEIGSTWPLLSAPPAGVANDRLLEGLVQAFVAEAVAGVQGLGPDIRALLAAMTTDYYLALSETGAAERSLARARDLLSKVPADEPRRVNVTAMVRLLAAQLSSRLGDTETAGAARAEELPAGLGSGSLLTRRAIEAEHRERVALAHFERGEFQEALGEYPACIEELRQIDAEVEQTDDAILAASVRNNLSGALANFGALLSEIANHVEIATAVYSDRPLDRPGRFSEIDVERTLALIDRLRPTLRQVFPDGFGASRLREIAVSLLNDALERSESAHHWTFAAIQAHRLAGLADVLGDTQAAVSFAERAVEHARRCGDHVRAWSSLLYLAQRDLAAKDGQAALRRLEEASLEWVHDAVGRGRHATSAESPAKPIVRAILEAIDLGADATRGVLLVENLKATTTGTTLAAGPSASAFEAAPELAARFHEANQARERLRLELMWDPWNPEIRTALRRAEEDLAEQRHELNLRNPNLARAVDASDVRLLSDVEAFRRQMAALGPRTQLLGVFVLESELLTYLVGLATTKLVRRPLADVPALRNTDSATLVGLSELIIRPFERELTGAPDDRLIISPDFGFFDVPYAALPLGNAPLCARATLSFVQGLGVFEALRDRTRRDFRRAIALGGPVRPDRVDLVRAREEAVAVQRMFDDSRPALVGAPATIAALVENAEAADVWHLACHADGISDIDGLARLLLAPSPLGGDSGILSEDRIITELHPSGAFVNLAGCATAIQVDRAGPLLGGLVPAFLAAGASAVLAATRPIEDGEATAFQLAFYERLRLGSSPATSLALCQRACLTGALGAAMAEPESWSPYVLYGVE